MGQYEDPMIYNVNAPLPSSPHQLNHEHLFAFYPVEGSPAIDSGQLIWEKLKESPGEYDLVGFQIPSGVGYDCGAFEHAE